MKRDVRRGPPAGLLLAAGLLASPVGPQQPSAGDGHEWCGVVSAPTRVLQAARETPDPGQAAPPVDLAAGQTAPTEPVEVTILFFYTQQFLDATPGADTAARRRTMRKQIRKSIDLANEAFRNSGVNATLRMVGLEKSSAMPDSKAAGDWIINDRLAKKHRNRTAADLVYGLVDDPAGYGGSACIPVRGAGRTHHREICFQGVLNSEDKANFDHDKWPAILRHEVGHNLGLQHDPWAGGSSTGGGLADGSVGYRSPRHSPSYGTIMSPASVMGRMIPRFSTSSTRWGPWLIGDKGVHEASSVLRQTVKYVSSYRSAGGGAGAVPAVSLPTSLSVAEGDDVEAEVTLDVGFGEPITFDVTYGGSASGASDPAAGDYDDDAMTALTFLSVETSKTIRIPVTDDGKDESDETITVTISPSGTLPTGFALGNTTMTVTITDNDASPVLDDIDDVEVRAGQPVDITAAATDEDNDTIGYAWTRRSGETPALPGGTALNAARLTFTPTSPGTYTMTVTADDGNGNTDTEDVTITVTTGGTVSVSGALSVAESAGSAAVRATASAALGESVTFAVRYGGSATGAASPGSGDDYDNDAVTQVVFSSTDTAKDIVIPIRDDGLDEDSETIEVTIALAPGITLPAGFELGATTTTVTIADDDESPVLSTIAARTVAVGQVVDITAAATDGDSDPITYAWTRKSSETLPALPDGTSLNQAQLTFRASAVGTYTMTMTASDGNGNSDTEAVTITVTAADPDDDGGGNGPPGGNPGGDDGSSNGGDGSSGSNGDSSGGGSDSGGDGGDSGAGEGGGSGGDPGDGAGGGGGDSGGSTNDDGDGGGTDDDGGDRSDDGAGDDGDDDDDDDDREGPGGNDGGSGGGGGSGSVGGPVRASFTLDAPCADGLCRARTGVPVSFRDSSSGAVTSRNWSLGDGTTSRSRSLEHAWAAPGFYTVSLTVGGRGPSSTVSRKVLVEAADPVGACTADEETLCLQDSRFSVTMDWWTEDGAESRRGAGKVVHEGTNDSGLFWFFSAVNWELLVKVLDGCSVNGRMWVYGASATTLGYVLTVTDTVTGAVQEYRNEPGRQAPAFTDSAAFPGSCADAAPVAAAAGDSGPLPVTAPSPESLSEPAPAQHLAVAAVSVAAPAEDGSCTKTASAMCLQGGRYEVTVAWSSLEGRSGRGRVAGPRTDDSGLFHFFSPANWEILVKVLDGCAFNDHHWVFAASATDVGFDLRVRDTATGRSRRYTKEAGKPARALVDISAFPEACQQP